MVVLVPVPDDLALPDWALDNNGQLRSFLRSITIRTLLRAFVGQTYFYIVFKCILVTITFVLLIRLIATGRWWLVRIVRVPRGLLICPNACEALVMVASVYYLIDLIYRGMSIRWQFDALDDQHGMAVVYGIRLYFLWLAAFIPVASSMLIWPLDPTRLRPIYWHTLLIGFPLLFFAAYVPWVILTEHYLQRTNGIALPLLRRFVNDKESAVSEQDKVLALQAYRYAYQTWSCARSFAIVAVAFLIPVAIASIACGYTVVLRSWVRFRQVKRDLRLNSLKEDVFSAPTPPRTSSHERGSVVLTPPGVVQPKTAEGKTPSNFASLDTINVRHNNDRNASQQASHRRSPSLHWNRLSYRRRLAYLLGLAPIRRIDDSAKDRGPPTLRSVKAVLKDFLIFSIVQYVCLIVLQLTMVACGSLIIVSLLPDLRSQQRVANFDTTFVRTTYYYISIEIWSLVVFGTPLILLMLWRQLNPIRVDFTADEYARQQGGSAPKPSVIERWRTRDGQMRPPSRHEPIPFPAPVAAVEDRDKAKPAPIWPRGHLEEGTLEEIEGADTQGTLRSLDHNRRVSGGTIGSMTRSTSQAGAHDIVLHRSLPSIDVAEVQKVPDEVVNEEEEEESDDEDEPVGQHSFPPTTPLSPPPLILMQQSRHGLINHSVLTMQDACGLSGSDAGVRRIVLEALAASDGRPGSATDFWPERKSTIRQRAAAAREEQRQYDQRLEQERKQRQPKRRRSKFSLPPVTGTPSKARQSSTKQQQRRHSGYQSPSAMRFATPHGVIERSARESSDVE